MTRADVVRRTLAVALVSLAASSVFIRLFGLQPVLMRLFPAVILCCLGYALGTAGGQRVQRGNGALVGLILTVVTVLALGAMTLPDEDGQTGPDNALEGLVEGLKIILESVVPAPVTAETVTFVIMIVAYGALVSCLAVTSFVPASSLVPAFVVFLSGLALSQGSPMSALPFAAAMVLASVVALSLLPASPAQNSFEDGSEFAEIQTAPTPGKGVRALLVVVMAALITPASIALGVSSGIGDLREPFDPHKKNNFRPDTDLNGDDVVSLATKWQTLRRNEPTDLFTIGGQIPRAVSWASIAKFDGVAWSSLSTFDQIGPLGIPYAGAQERFTITGTTAFETLKDLPGPWLPATFRPTNVRGVPARADAEATVVAGDDQGAEKVYDVDYRALAMRSLKPLATVGAVPQPEYGTLRELPRDFPLELRYFAASAMSTADVPYDQLEALANALSGPEYEERVDGIRSPLDVSALRELVLVSKSGTQAQFATAFALMARSQGYPTRLAVGYGVRGKGKQRTVRSTDVIIYPEVQLTKVGWVPFAPGPRDLERGVPVIKRYKPAKADKPDKTKPEPEPEPTPSPEPEPSPSPEPQPEQAGSPLRQLLLPLLLIIALAAWPALVAWRRRRIRAAFRDGGPDQQVVGAWAYVRYWRRRLRAPLADTLSPAHYAVAPDADPQLAELARLSEAAMYAPEVLTPQQADRAWWLADHLVAGAVRSGGITRRLRWLLLYPLRGKPTRLDAKELIRA